MKPRRNVTIGILVVVGAAISLGVTVASPQIIVLSLAATAVLTLAMWRPYAVALTWLAFLPFSHGVFIVLFHGEIPLLTDAILLVCLLALVLHALGNRSVLRRPALPLITAILFFAAMSSSFLGSSFDQYLSGLRLVAYWLAFFILGAITSPRPAFLERQIVIFTALGIVVGAIGVILAMLPIDQLTAMGFRYGFEIRQVGSLLRAAGTFRDPFSFAHFEMLALIVAVAGRHILLTRFRPAVVYAGLMVLVIALVMSFVRDAWVGAAVGLAVTEAMRQRLVLAYVAICAGTVFIVALGSGVMAVDSGIAAPQASAASRLEIWTSYLADIPHHPLGRGLGTVGATSESALRWEGVVARGYTASGSYVANYEPVDSQYISVLAQGGIAALLLFLVAMTILWTRGLQAYNRAASNTVERVYLRASLGMLSALLIVAITRNVLEESVVGYIFWFVCGSIVAVLRTPAAVVEGIERLQPRST